MCPDSDSVACDTNYCDLLNDTETIQLLLSSSFVLRYRLLRVGYIISRGTDSEIQTIMNDFEMYKFFRRKASLHFLKVCLFS